MESLIKMKPFEEDIEMPSDQADAKCAGKVRSGQVTTTKKS